MFNPMQAQSAIEGAWERNRATRMGRDSVIGSNEEWGAPFFAGEVSMRMNRRGGLGWGYDVDGEEDLPHPHSR